MQTVRYDELPSLASQELGTSGWLPVTQDRVGAFAGATGDDQWIHVDPARAVREIGGAVAHGLLLLSLIPLLRRDIVAIEGQARTVNYGFDRVRFPASVRAGDRVRMRSRLLAAGPKLGGIQATMEHAIEAEHAQGPACVAQAISLFLPA